MLITQMTPKGKAKTIVEIDGDRTIVLPNQDLARYDIREGEEIPEEHWQALLTELDTQARRKCTGLLKDRDYTEKELERKLLAAGYPEEALQTALDAVRGAGLVDDRRYASEYLQYHAADRSRLRLKADLEQKGISSSVLEEVFADWEAQQGEEIRRGEIRRICHLLEKRGYDPETFGQEQTQKLIRFLQGKGYTYEVIRAAMRFVGEEIVSDEGIS